MMTCYIRNFFFSKQYMLGCNEVKTGHLLQFIITVLYLKTQRLINIVAGSETSV